MSTTRPRRLSLSLLGAVVAALVALSGCAGSDDGGGSDAGNTDVDAVAPAGGEAERRADGDLADGLAADQAADFAEGSAPREEAEPDGLQPAIIYKGSVALRSKDVEKAAFDVQAVADQYGGQVTDRKTTTDDDGEARFARMVLRIPAADFDEAFAELEEVADLQESSANSEDVTTQMIDNQVRIRAQRRSLQRVEVLLDRAQSIRDIVAIEAQLTRRQADLDSLEQRQAYLRDQTTLSTIVVNVERTEEEPETKPEQDDDGFLSGLSAGWDALRTVGTALATTAGALLPFAVVLTLLGIPAWVLVRRTRRRGPVTVPADGS